MLDMNVAAAVDAGVVVADGDSVDFIALVVFMLLLCVDIAAADGDQDDAVIVGVARLRETAILKAMQRARRLTFYHSLKGLDRRIGRQHC